MSSNISQQTCIPRKERHLCPSVRNICPGRCKPGFCLNAQCLYSTRPEVVYCRPDVEREADFNQRRIEQAVKQQKMIERAAFLASERKQMGMPDFEEPEKKDNNKALVLSEPQKTFRRSMRPPARPACMLNVPEIFQTHDDYSQLSLFLRTSTMPGYARNDTVSEYRDTHNLAVWNNRKDIDRQINKMRRDWLSEWSIQNFKEQRWRKDWQDKFSGLGKL